MMFRRVLLICLIWPALSSAAPADDSDVLAAVVADICGVTSSLKYVVLDTSTDLDSTPAYLDNTEISPDVAHDLKERNKLNPRLPRNVDYKCMRFTDATRVDSLFRAESKRDGWKEFYRHFPSARGIIRLTFPGYSASNVDAAVLTSHECGWLCGSGQLYVLHRTGNAWIVVKRTGLWIS